MTKVIILGEAAPEQTKKPIEFINLVSRGACIKASGIPRNYKNIELICRSYDGCFDLMYAYDSNRDSGNLYFGHFNDGVVE